MQKDEFGVIGRQRKSSLMRGETRAACYPPRGQSLEDAECFFYVLRVRLLQDWELKEASTTDQPREYWVAGAVGSTKTDFKTRINAKKMKRVVINTYQIGLVFKNGAYKRMLKEGSYWLWASETVEIYDLTRPFTPAYELNILLKDTDLAEALHVVEVGDHEIVLQYENGLLKQVLGPGRYAYWKAVINYGFVRADLRKIGITEDIDRPTLAQQTGRFFCPELQCREL